MVSYFIISLVISYVSAVQYVVDPEGKKDFEGVGIGLVSRPTYCEKTTRKGDLMRVYFNGTLGDGSIVDNR